MSKLNNYTKALVFTKTKGNGPNAFIQLFNQSINNDVDLNCEFDFNETKWLFFNNNSNVKTTTNGK